MNCDETLESIWFLCDGWLCCWLRFVESASSDALASRGFIRCIFLQEMNCICNLGQLCKQNFYLKREKIATDRCQNGHRGPDFFLKNLTWQRNIHFLTIIDKISIVDSVVQLCGFRFYRLNLSVARSSPGGDGITKFRC